MPIYALKCQKCGVETTKRMTMSEEIPSSCDVVMHTGCDGHLMKVVSAPLVNLKGGGWSKDGYFKQK